MDANGMISLPVGRKASRGVVESFQASNRHQFLRTQNYKDCAKVPRDANFFWLLTVKGPEGLFNFSLMQNKEGNFHVWYMGGWGDNAKAYSKGRNGNRHLQIDGQNLATRMFVEPFDINHSGVFLVTFEVAERPSQRQRLNDIGNYCRRLKTQWGARQLREFMLANKFKHIELAAHVKHGVGGDLGHSWIIVVLHNSQRGKGGLQVGDGCIIELAFGGAVNWQIIREPLKNSRLPATPSRWVDERTFVAVCRYWEDYIGYNVLSWNCHSFARNLCSIAWPEIFESEGAASHPFWYKARPGGRGSSSWELPIVQGPGDVSDRWASKLAVARCTGSR